ncbi:cbb3-type cytochrome c oxidase subunit I [Fodinibius halophilus]|uniref:Cytochrome C oxidase subunit I n=1 Tax=Fodinibius halophilus TaxID=1736908 RepID=A0A6M1T9S1_9BACT|nr:cbb3-type cytochrome c oxidase subunit I [Fodinibius halophilus]NGP88781.1 cytochrome C oxidase subunit I [Fodinibius halophilus]
MNATQAIAKFRTCKTTGLRVFRNAEFFTKVNAVLAVVFLLVGAIAAIGLALTRWTAVHLLGSVYYYRMLTLHGVNMLVFWIIFMEMGILYFACTTLLNSRLFSKMLGWISLALMGIGALMTNYIILAGQADVLLTSYVPLKAHPMFYLGIILFAVGALIVCFNFFATLYIAKRDETYEGSMPLVTFGAMAAAIIAVLALAHGAAALIPTFMWSMGWIGPVDPGLYRLLWWGLGHMSQQINVCAMVSVWYFMGTMTTGAKPLNETVCRGAFLLYILFINLASAHHLLVDPGVGPGWKIWNTSYAMYLAVLASMIHGYTVPASLEVAQRRKGFTKGIFGWFSKLPWKDPGFSAVMLSIIIFGFMGGITGVTLGTEQINIIAHNTLRIPGHFHATVVGGTSLAFMGLAYYLVPLIFQKEFYLKGLARIQPYVFGGGIVVMSLGMSFAGSYGVPRRHWDVDFSGSILSAGFDPIAHVMLGLVGIGGIIAFLGLLLFIGLTVATVFFGRSNEGRPMESWQDEHSTRMKDELIEKGYEEEGKDYEHIKTPGTLTVVIIFLLTFAVYYFANWKALADLWFVR